MHRDQHISTPAYSTNRLTSILIPALCPRHYFVSGYLNHTAPSARNGPWHAWQLPYSSVAEGGSVPKVPVPLDLNLLITQSNSPSLLLHSITNISIMAHSTTTTLDLIPEPVFKLPERPKGDGSALTEHERSEIAFVDKYSAPDVYISEKNDTLWFPWIGPIELKPTRMENRTGTFVVGLRSKVAASLGKHRHRGTVTAITMSGEWGYKEYGNPNFCKLRLC
jgi:hypothetical protein